MANGKFDLLEAKVDKLAEQMIVGFERLSAIIEKGHAQTNERLLSLEKGQAQTNERLFSLEKGQAQTNERLLSLEKGQAQTNERLLSLERGQEQTNERLLKLEKGQTRVENGQSHLSGQMMVTATWLQSMDQRFVALMHPYETRKPAS